MDLRARGEITVTLAAAIERAKQNTAVAYVEFAKHCVRACGMAAKIHALSAWRQLSSMCQKRAKRRSNRLQVSLHAEADPNALRVSWDDRALSFGLYAVAQIHQGAIDADLAVGDVLHRVDGTDVLRSRVDGHNLRLVDALLRRPEGAECDFMRAPLGDGKNPPLLRTWTQIAFESSAGGLSAITPNETINNAGSQVAAFGEKRANFGGERSEPGGDLVFRSLGEEASQQGEEIMPDAKVDNSCSARFLRARGHQNDGIRSDGLRSDCVWSDSHRSDGHQGDGIRSGGHQSDGHRSDGHRSDGHRSDGHRSGGHRSGGFRTDGVWSDGFRSDGFRGDGFRSDGFRSEGSEIRRRGQPELSDRLRGVSDLSDCPSTDWEFPSPHKVFWRYGREFASASPLAPARESEYLPREFSVAESNEPLDLARSTLHFTRGPSQLSCVPQHPQTITPDPRTHQVFHGTQPFPSQLRRRSPHRPVWGTTSRHPAVSSTAPIDCSPAPAPIGVGATTENTNSSCGQSSSSKLSAHAQPFVPSSVPYFGYGGGTYTGVEPFNTGYSLNPVLASSPGDTVLHRPSVFPSMVQCETAVAPQSYEGFTWADGPPGPCVMEHNGDVGEHQGEEAVVTEDDVAASFDFLNSPDRVSSQECHSASPETACVRPDMVTKVLFEDEEEKGEGPNVAFDTTAPLWAIMNSHDSRPVISLAQLMPLAGDAQQGALPAQQDGAKPVVEGVRGARDGSMYQYQHKEQEHQEEEQHEHQGEQAQEEQQRQEEDGRGWWQRSFSLSDVLHAQHAALFAPEPRNTHIPPFQTCAPTHNDKQENKTLPETRPRKHRRGRRRRTKSPVQTGDDTNAPCLYAQPNPTLAAESLTPPTNGVVDTASTALPVAKATGYKPSLPTFLLYRKDTPEHKEQQPEHKEQQPEHKEQQVTAHPKAAAPAEAHAAEAEGRAGAEAGAVAGAVSGQRPVSHKKKDETKAKKVVLTRVLPPSAVGWRPSLRPISSLLNPK